MSTDDIELLARGAWRIYKEHGPSDAMTWDRFGEHGKETWRDIVRSVLAAAQPPAVTGFEGCRRCACGSRVLMPGITEAEHEGTTHRVGYLCYEGDQERYLPRGSAAQSPAPITAEDVRAAEELWRAIRPVSTERAAFVADYLNRRRERT